MEIPTKDELRDIILSDDLFMALDILSSGWVPLEHAVLAGNLHVSSGRLKESLTINQRARGNVPPEHEQLDKAIEDAVEAAEVAFDAALNAAWQLLYLAEHCDCPACRLRHQRENAGHQ